MIAVFHKARHRLTFLQWCAAYDRWAVAAAACSPPQLEYAAALAHKDVVLEVCRYLCVFALACFIMLLSRFALKRGPKVGNSGLVLSMTVWLASHGRSAQQPKRLVSVMLCQTS